MLTQAVKDFLTTRLKSNLSLHLPFSFAGGIEAFRRINSEQYRYNVLWSSDAELLPAYLQEIRQKNIPWGIDISLPYNNIADFLGYLAKTDKTDIIPYIWIPKTFNPAKWREYLDILKQLATNNIPPKIVLNQPLDTLYLEVRDFLNKNKIQYIINDDNEIGYEYSGRFNQILSGPCHYIFMPDVLSDGRVNLCRFCTSSKICFAGSLEDGKSLSCILKEELFDTKRVLIMALGPFRLWMILLHFFSKELKEILEPEDYNVLMYFYNQIVPHISDSLWPQLYPFKRVSDRLKEYSQQPDASEFSGEKIESLCVFCRMLGKYDLKSFLERPPFQAREINNVVSLFIIVNR